MIRERGLHLRCGRHTPELRAMGIRDKPRAAGGFFFRVIGSSTPEAGDSTYLGRL